MKHFITLIMLLYMVTAGSLKAATADYEKFAKDSSNFWAIDMTLLEVEGKHYAVWSGWDKYYENSEAPAQNLYIAPIYFSDEKPYVSLGRRVLLSEPELPWELKHEEHISLLEGPSALYHEGDVFIIYSTRGSWTENYKMGQLKLKKGGNPLLRDDWEKYPEPVFSGVYKSDGLGYEVLGTGHASYVTSPDGKEYWVNYHAKTSDGTGWGDRMVYLQKFTFGRDGNPEFGIPANPNIPMQRPSGEVRIEKRNGTRKPSETFLNPLFKGADPWIVMHDGKYYTCRSGAGGIWITESSFISCFDGGKTLEQAKKKVWSLPKDESRWNTVSLWAPELHYVEGKWYIFYAAGKNATGPFWTQRAGVLVSSDGPFGPYEECDDKPLFTGDAEK